MQVPAATSALPSTIALATGAPAVGVPARVLAGNLATVPTGALLNKLPATLVPRPAVRLSVIPIAIIDRGPLATTEQGERGRHSNAAGPTNAARSKG